MAYIELLSVQPLKLVLFSIISYFVYVHLLKPFVHLIHMIIHYHGFHYHPKHFLLGHLKDIWPNFPFPIDAERRLRNISELTDKIVDLNPSRSLSVLWILLFPIIYASDHEAVEIILNKKNLKKPHFYKFMGLGDGLVTSEPVLWKVRRKLIEPFFSTRKMRGHIKYINEEVESFSQQLNSHIGKPVDLEHQIHNSTLNIILKSIASMPLDDSMDDKRKFLELIETLEKNCVRRLSNPFYQLDCTFNLFKFGQFYHKTIQDIEKFMNKILSRRKQMLKCSPSNESKDQDFVHLLEGKVDEQGLLDELITLIGAGHDTIAVALRWILFNLGNHFDTQENLYQEIIHYFPDDTPLDDMDKINQCNYLDQCIKESLRLNPPANITLRILDEDIMVKDKRLLKGSIVCVSITATHRDPRVYPEPDKFDPDRWSPENVSKIPKAAFIPFSYGPRSCIGYRYAMLELKIYLIQIIRKFSLISTRKHGSIPLKAEVTLKPVLPLEIIMSPRNNNEQELTNSYYNKLVNRLYLK